MKGRKNVCSITSNSSPTINMTLFNNNKLCVLVVGIVMEMRGKRVNVTRSEARRYRWPKNKYFSGRYVFIFSNFYFWSNSFFILIKKNSLFAKF